MFVESDARERLCTGLVGQQVTKETVEVVEGFSGVAQCPLQESSTKRIGEQIVDDLVLEGLTECVEALEEISDVAQYTLQESITKGIVEQR